MNDVLGHAITAQDRLIWYYLTSFLSHAAMISKYLSPISKCDIALARKKVLRELLHVQADSEVLPRDARDNVEHFDERIDNWIGGENHNIVEIVVQSRSDYNYLRMDKKRVRRALILDEFVFISEKKDCSKFELGLVPLHDEVRRIGLEAEQWIASRSPYHFLAPR
ncbi:hypothetical protein [Noviherbaspirillum pedocola]|uniref:Uncharacterized protein n=1 Tax=Noviherbaspirillum pedocola TaxID=2801341 RepID=A0A934W7E8_9BURK|nr:hypothetical protein [Noviherbaspirillum pedocola]MBK4737352.1 hypothetical protein [Noviherbaspirillum pedocola]